MADSIARLRPFAQHEMGDTIQVRHTYGLTTPEWREGIVTDKFLAPMTGTWVYVVAGCGYYESETRTDV